MVGGDRRGIASALLDHDMNAVMDQATMHPIWISDDGQVVGGDQSSGGCIKDSSDDTGFITLIPSIIQAI